MNEFLSIGSEVKMTEDGHVSGYLVLFGDPKARDFDGDFFTKDTDFDIDFDNPHEAKSTVYFHHGMDRLIGKKKLGAPNAKGTLKMDEIGVWIDAWLDTTDEYDQAVIRLNESRKSHSGRYNGWSSGVPSHLVEREEVAPGVFHIKKWALGKDASITPIPNDWRNQVYVKSASDFLPLDEAVNASDSENLDDAKAEPAKALNGEPITGETFISISTKGTQNMSDNTPIQPVEDNELKRVVDAKTSALMANQDNDLRAEVKTLSETISGLLKHMEDEPAIRKSGYFTQDGGNADANVKSFGDFLMAIARKDDVRLKSVYGSGYYKAQTGDSGGAGGYLIPETFSNQLMQIVQRNSDIVNGVTHQRVPTRSGWMPSLDLTTAPSAGGGESAFGSGVGTNIRAEGGAYTEETANFDRVLYNVSDFASGYVKASREMMQEAMGLEQLLRSLIALQQTEKIEKGILRGTGSSQPLGILNSSAAVSVTVDSDNVFADTDMAEMISRFKVVAGSLSDDGLSGGCWIMHRSVLPDIYNFETGTGGSVWNTNIAQGPTMVLDGRPIKFSEHLPQANNAGCVILADLKSYILFELGGMYIDYSEHADFLNGNDVWRYGARVDGKPWLNNKITLADPQGSFTVSPFVYLND